MFGIRKALIAHEEKKIHDTCMQDLKIKAILTYINEDMSDKGKTHCINHMVESALFLHNLPVGTYETKHGTDDIQIIKQSDGKIIVETLY